MRVLLPLVLLSASAVAQPVPGDLAPDPEVETFLAAPPLASWAGLEGQAVVMDLWATWCAPCVATLPHMAALADSFAGRPVQFLSVSDEPVETVEPFLEGRAVAGWIGIDSDGSSRRAYGVVGIPAVVLVYPDGRLAAVTHPREVDGAAVEALLAGDPLAVPPVATGETLRDAMARQRGYRPAVADGPPAFRVAWGPEDAMGGAVGNLREGWMEATGYPLVRLLTDAWRAGFPYGTDPVGHFLRWDFIDVPDSLRMRLVDAEVHAPGLSRAAFGDSLFAGLADALDLDVRRESRPDTVWVLRPHPDRLVTLDRDGGRRSSSSSDGVVAINGSTAFEIAQSLSSVFRRLVVDESGLEGTYKVLLEADPQGDPPGTVSAATVEAFRAALLDETGLDLVPTVRPVEWLVVRPRSKGGR